MFSRKITDTLTKATASFYAVALLGPRQSGKTTLLKWLFPDYRYINLESPDMRALIEADPYTFFADPKQKWIINEAQECPVLFSFLLNIIDTHKTVGQFVLCGSKNFVLLDKITQSLAGRIAILELLPLSHPELLTAKSDYTLTTDLWEQIHQGSYPGLLSRAIDPQLWYNSYVTTYLERDVRQILNIKDLNKFHLFLKLCAGRHGQLLNLSQLGDDCGISHTTVKEWISILEASYIIYRLPPYYKNINKRFIKTPKLYFLDSGLICYLLGIESASHLQLHAARGAIFEGYLVCELIKTFYNRAKKPPIYFCKLYSGTEVDLLIEQGDKTALIEIKSSATFSRHFTKQLVQFQKSPSFAHNSTCYTFYAGNESFTTKGVQVEPWYHIHQLGT